MAAAAAGTGDMREENLPDEARAARLLPGAVHRTLVATEAWLPALAVGVAAFGALVALLLVLLELDLLVVAMVAFFSESLVGAGGAARWRACDVLGGDALWLPETPVSPAPRLS